jgi:dTDP-glucose 4,6-dehydratase
MLDSPDTILADIRDAEIVQRIFKDRQPQVIFHAAALKHLPMLEQYPVEAWKTNVVGTLNVLEAAQLVGVEKFVNISTDKAANPCSVLGKAKRIGERLVAAMASDDESGVPVGAFRQCFGQSGIGVDDLRRSTGEGFACHGDRPGGDPLFDDDPRGGAAGHSGGRHRGPGEALVLDMGAPVRIVDLARELMAIAGRPAPIVYTGLRTGEKMHEELFADGEDRPWHPAISHATVPPLYSSELHATARAIGPAAALHDLATNASGPPPRVQAGETVSVAGPRILTQGHHEPSEHPCLANNRQTNARRNRRQPGPYRQRAGPHRAQRARSHVPRAADLLFPGPPRSAREDIPYTSSVR